MGRRWLLIAGVGLGGLIVLVGVGVALLYGPVAAWVIEQKVVPRLERKLGREVAVGAIDVERGRVVLRDVVVPGDDGAPLIAVAEIAADVSFWPSLVGSVEVGEVVLDGLRVTAVRRKDGDNFGQLVAALRGDRAAEEAPGDGGDGGGGGPRPTAVVVRGGHLELRDEREGVTIVAEGVGARVAPDQPVSATIADLAAITAFGPYADLEQVAITASLDDPLGTALVVVGGGELELWRGMSLSGVSGSIGRGEAPGTLAIDLAGGYAGVDGTLWRARGWFDPTARRGDVRLQADRFTFARIAPVLRDSPVIEFEDTTMDAVVDLKLDGPRARVSGEASIAGLNLFHAKLAPEPMRGLAGRVALSARYDRDAKVLEVDEARVESGGVEYLLTAKVADIGERAPGDAWLVNRRLEARLRIPAVPCQTMLDAIPPEFVPHLQGFKLRGTFATDVTLALDWTDLEAAVLDGSVGIKGCKVTAAPADMDPKRLKESFDHEVEIAEGVWETMRIGPESDDFVPLAEVSPHLINSLMTTEDSGFYKHRGFIVREFRTALIKDLQAGYFKYGASSITMQTVKNVFLGREKTLGRKLQELFLTWYLEQVLEKDRILEIYVNAIEYGPGLYGIKPAAMQYFGKPPSEINPTEAAFFSSILPAPKQRYVQFCKDKVTPWTHAKIQRILDHMVKRERLSLPEFEVAMATPLVFQPNKRDFCTRKWSQAR